MSVRSHVARLGAGALVVGVAVLGPAPAQAAEDLTMITRVDNVKLLACKAPTNGGDSWLIRPRVHNPSAEVATASMTAFRNGRTTRRSWQSGDVRPRSTSRVGRLVVPRRAPGWTLLSTIAIENAGNGDERPIGRIGRC